MRLIISLKVQYFEDKQIRGVAQLIECIVWDDEAAGLSPATPTNRVLKNVYTKYTR